MENKMIRAKAKQASLTYKTKPNLVALQIRKWTMIKFNDQWPQLRLTILSLDLGKDFGLRSTQSIKTIPNKIIILVIFILSGFVPSDRRGALDSDTHTHKALGRSRTKRTGFIWIVKLHCFAEFF